MPKHETHPDALDRVHHAWQLWALACDEADTGPRLFWSALANLGAYRQAVLAATRSCVERETEDAARLLGDLLGACHAVATALNRRRQDMPGLEVASVARMYDDTGLAAASAASALGRQALRAVYARSAAQRLAMGIPQPFEVAS